MITIFNEDVFYEMAKLTADYADESLCGDFSDFIYFSPSLDAHGPRVKFYGGTKETSTTRNAPTLAFTNNGETSLRLADWMNKKNCPNAFNDEYVKKIDTFINKFLPILLLVWYNKLDEAHALKFFEGQLSRNDLLKKCSDVDKNIINDMCNSSSMKKVHKICVENNLYAF